MKTVIRSYRPETDESGLRECFVALQDHEHDFAPEALTGAELVDEYVPFMLERVRETGGVIFIAELEGNIIGFATAIVTQRTEPDDIDPFHVEVTELSVLPEARSHGIGRKLLDAAERFARDKGSPSLILRVLAKNAGARRFYERFGLDDWVHTLRKEL